MINVKMCRWLALLVLILPALSQAQVQADTVQVRPAKTGPWAVGRTTFQVVDPERDERSLAVDVWYPVDDEDAAGAPASLYDLVFVALESPLAVQAPPSLRAGPRPMVVFSHGSFGIRFQSFFLTEHLASHGFVVVAPDHSGNTAADILFDTVLPFEQMVVARPLDISFVITQMLEKNADPADAFFNRIDAARIAVTGHSFGGYTALAMASGFNGIAPDARVSAIAPLAPASGILTSDQLALVDVPTLLLSGTADITTPIKPNTTAPWQHVSGRPLFRADIIAAGHQSFTDICVFTDALVDLGLPPDLVAFLLGNADEGCAPELIPIEQAHRITRHYLTAFMRSQIGGHPGSQLFLTPFYADIREPDVFFQRRSVATDR